MIKIHKKLWYVVKPEHEDNLAYMCSYVETKENTPDAATQRMQNTGRGWASVAPKNAYKIENGVYVKDEYGRLVVGRVEPAKEGVEAITDNTPVAGFYIGDSVSRWTTDNKLFRVKDPRGFTVEVPTGNIATLLHHTTVKNGVVQEECVWGREGNSHILLPINSQPYLDTLDKMDVLDNRLIPLKELKEGQWVKFFEDNTLYYYMGKVRATWSVRGVIRGRYNHYKGGCDPDTYTEPVIVKDDKWVDVFLCRYSWSKGSDKWAVETPSKPKIVDVVKTEPMLVGVDDINMYCPERVKNKSGYNDGSYYWVEGTLTEIERKNK